MSVRPKFVNDDCPGQVFDTANEAEAAGRAIAFERALVEEFAAEFTYKRENGAEFAVKRLLPVIERMQKRGLLKLTAPPPLLPTSSEVST